MTSRAVVQAIAAKARAITGMRAAPDNPPDSIAAYPFAVTYFMRGAWHGADATWGDGRVTYACDVHLSRLPDTGRQLETCAEMPRTLALAILSDETLGGACTAVFDVRCQFTRMGYSGIETAGYRFEIDIVANEAKS